MIKPFKFYLDKNLVRKNIPNLSMAKSLFDKAELRFKRIGFNKIEENEASIVFEDIYECLREAVQSLMELKGYKPYSHEVLAAFLNEEKLLPLDKINIIDNYRILRNNSVYKAEKVSIDKCKEALEFANKTLPEIHKKLRELIK